MVDGGRMAGHSFQIRQHTPPHLDHLTYLFLSLPSHFLLLSPQTVFSTVTFAASSLCRHLTPIPFEVAPLLVYPTVTMGAHSAVWQGYVDSSLMGSGQFDKAAILSVDFSGIEASSPGFTISPQEIQALGSAFGDSTYAMQHGFTIGGEKFFAIRADDRSLYGKKGKEGAVVVRTVSCVMIGHHNEAVQTPNAAAALEKVADYINGSSR